MVEKRGDILSLLPISKFTRQSGHLLAEKYYFNKTVVVVLWGNCPTNEGSFPIGVIVVGGGGVMGKWVVVLGGNCPHGSCLRGSCAQTVVAEYLHIKGHRFLKIRGALRLIVP